MLSHENVIWTEINLPLLCGQKDHLTKNQLLRFNSLLCQKFFNPAMAKKINMARLVNLDFFDGMGSPWLRGHKHLTGNEDLRLWVQSPAAHTSNFPTPDGRKTNKAPSVRVIVI